MNSTLTGRILLPFVVVATIVLTVLFTLEPLGRRVDNAHEVERRLISVQLQLRDISAQVQGGILTGQERFAIQAATAALEALCKRPLCRSQRQSHRESSSVA